MKGQTIRPTIRINRSHWIVDSQPGALILGQIYTYGNTGDRTYLGQMLEGVDEPVTVGLRLPAGAEEISFENGVLGDRFLQVGDTIYDTLPVVPGEDTRQIIVRYALPYNGTAVDLAQDFIYPVDQLSLLVADLPNLNIDVAGMESGGTQDVQGRSYQIWSKGSFEPETIDDQDARPARSRFG